MINFLNIRGLVTFAHYSIKAIMKIRLSVLALASVLVLACEEKQEGFVINAEVDGELADNTAVYLKQNNAQNRPVDRDTAYIKDGKFSFQGDQQIPELHYLFIEGIRGNIPVVVENGSIKVSAHKDSLSFASRSGTQQNDLFADFLTSSREISKKVMSMNDDMRAAAASRDTATMAALRDEYFEIQEEAKSFELNFAKENPNALISAFIVDKALVTKSIPENEIQELYNSLSDEIKNTRIGKKIGDTLQKSANVAIGAKAPDFSAPTPDGGSMALKDALGKYTIVDFWAAWCKPCRAENPNIVRVYNKYHDKGLNILGVSLDRKEEDWKKAIADDGLEWYHVSNLRYFDEIAKLYNVSAIPAMFVLDENGVIVAKNLRGPALEAKIAELFNEQAAIN